MQHTYLHMWGTVKEGIGEEAESFTFGIRRGVFVIVCKIYLPNVLKDGHRWLNGVGWGSPEGEPVLGVTPAVWPFSVGFVDLILYLNLEP